MTAARKLDEIDLQIIQLLQEDSRLSFRHIADSLKIASGTAYNRIKNLENSGVLKNYTVTVDPAKVGYDLVAVILIQGEGKYLPQVEADIANLSSVVSVYDITGDFDIAVTARFKNRSELNAFIKDIQKIPYIKRTVTNVVLNVIKEDFTLKPNSK